MIKCHFLNVSLSSSHVFHFESTVLITNSNRVPFIDTGTGAGTQRFYLPRRLRCADRWLSINWLDGSRNKIFQLVNNTTLHELPKRPAGTTSTIAIGAIRVYRIRKVYKGHTVRLPEGFHVCQEDNP